MRVATLLLTLGLPGLLPGQSVRGRVVGGGDSLPIPRAVVELRGVGTTFSARTTTSPSGAFAIAGPRAGRYQLRAAAIGFSPRRTEPFDLPAEGLRIDDVVLDRAVLTLRDLEVLETATRCGALGAGSTVLTRLLDGARTSLEVMEQSMRTSGSSFRIEAVRRTSLAGRGDSIVTADTTRGGLARWPIAAVDPEILRADGFMSRGNLDFREGSTWYGPDLGVLSADWFLASHCFHVDLRRSDSSSITLVFEPVERGELVDIAGTLVLDPKTLALTAMTFEHRNLPDRLPRGVAGGEIRFAPLPSGLWLPMEWRIFAPIQGQRSGRAMGIEERSGSVVGVVGGSGPATPHRDRPARRLEFNIPRDAMVPPDSLTDLTHYALAIDAACPEFAGLGRDALFDRERSLALEAGKAGATLDTWLALGCARAQLDVHGAFAREGLLMPLGDGWQAGATRAFLKVLEVDRLHTRASEVLAVMATEQAVPVEGEAIRSALAWAVSAGVTAPAAVRGCALLSLRQGDLAASNQCITIGLEAGGDSTWQLLHLARLASRSIDTATVSSLIDAALGAAHDHAAWREVGWHLRWFTEPAEWVEWLALPDGERAAWVRDRLATRDVKDGRRHGSRWVEHFQRLDYAEEQFARELPRRKRNLPNVAAAPEADPMGRSGNADRIRFTSVPENVAALPFRFYSTWSPLLDDRGVIWVRFGKPDKQIAWRSEDTFNVREAWYYDLQDGGLLLQFEGESFDGSNDATRLVAGVLGNYLCQMDQYRCNLVMLLSCMPPPPGARCSLDPEFSPVKPEDVGQLRHADEDLIEVATTTDDNAPRVAHPIAVVAQLARVWDPRSGGPLAVIPYALRIGNVSVDEDSGAVAAAVDLSLRQWSRASATWLETDVHRRLRFERLPEDGYLTGFVVIPSNPDVTAWSLVVSQGPDRRGRAWETDSPPLASGPLVLSDLILGAASQGQTWTTTTGTAVSLAPLGAFDKAEPVSLYWQVRSAVARDSVRIRVALFREEGRGEQAALALEFTERLGTGLTEISRRIGIDRLGGGAYRLEVTLSDPRTGDVAKRSARLLID